MFYRNIKKSNTKKIFFDIIFILYMYLLDGFFKLDFLSIAEKLNLIIKRQNNIKLYILYMFNKKNQVF
jgi:hypothetical protein